MGRPPNHNAKTARITFIPKPSQEEKARAFKEICARDGLTASEELYVKIEEWLVEHNYPPGNPQTLLFRPPAARSQPPNWCETCKGYICPKHIEECKAKGHRLLFKSSGAGKGWCVFCGT